MFGQKPIVVYWTPGITDYDPHQYSRDNPPPRPIAIAMLVDVAIQRGRQPEEELRRNPQLPSAAAELARRAQLEQ